MCSEFDSNLTGQFPLTVQNTQSRKILAQHLSILNLAGIIFRKFHSISIGLICLLQSWIHMSGKHIWVVLSTCKKVLAHQSYVGLSQETEKTGAYAVSKIVWRHCLTRALLFWWANTTVFDDFIVIHVRTRCENSLCEIGYANGIKGFGKLMTPSFHWNGTERITISISKERKSLEFSLR